MSEVKREKKHVKSLLTIVISIIALFLIYCAFVNTYSDFFSSRLGYGRYGKLNNVILYWHDDDVDLSIKKNGNIIFKQNKIFYFLPTDDYFYAITKWDEYIVVNLKNNKVILNTPNTEIIPIEHMNVFNNKEMFIDASDADNMVSAETVRFGDGTIYLLRFDDFGRLYTQKTDNGDSWREMTDEPIYNYLQKENLLYLVTQNNEYVIVDINAYKIIYQSNDLSLLSDKCQEVFSNDKMHDPRK